MNYLGGDMPTFTLNFSRPGNQIIGQYYNFVRLGRDGYRRIMESLRATALHLSSAIAALGPFEVVSDGSAIPVLAFKMNASTGFTVFDVSDRLRANGWQVPAYTMPADAEDVAVLRIVVREGFGMDLADMLLDSIWQSRRPPRAVPASARAARTRLQPHLNRPARRRPGCQVRELLLFRGLLLRRSFLGRSFLRRN